MCDNSEWKVRRVVGPPFQGSAIPQLLGLKYYRHGWRIRNGIWL